MIAINSINIYIIFKASTQNSMPQEIERDIYHSDKAFVKSCKKMFCKKRCLLKYLPCIWIISECKKLIKILNWDSIKIL